MINWKIIWSLVTWSRSIWFFDTTY